MLGIIAALPGEAHCFAKRKCLIKQPIRLNEDYLLYIGGIGADRARHAAEQLLAQGARALLSWGSAAGLSPELKTGDIVIPTHVIDQDTALYETTLSWQQQLYQQAQEIGKVYQAMLLQSHTAIGHHQQKHLFFKFLGAIAADMETVAIAATAKAHQVPFACVRVVVDPVDFNLPKLATRAINSNGQLQCRSLLWNLARYPFEWRTTYQLAHHFHHTKQRLQQLAQLQLIPPIYTEC